MTPTASAAGGQLTVTASAPTPTSTLLTRTPAAGLPRAADGRTHSRILLLTVAALCLSVSVIYAALSTLSTSWKRCPLPSGRPAAAYSRAITPAPGASPEHPTRRRGWSLCLVGALLQCFHAALEWVLAGLLVQFVTLSVSWPLTRAVAVLLAYWLGHAAGRVACARWVVPGARVWSVLHAAHLLVALSAGLLLIARPLQLPAAPLIWLAAPVLGLATSVLLPASLAVAANTPPPGPRSLGSRAVGGLGMGVLTVGGPSVCGLSLGGPVGGLGMGGIWVGAGLGEAVAPCVVATLAERYSSAQSIIAGVLTASLSALCTSLLLKHLLTRHSTRHSHQHTFHLLDSASSAEDDDDEEELVDGMAAAREGGEAELLVRRDARTGVVMETAIDDDVITR